MSDPTLHFVPRRGDANWFYYFALPKRIYGFNPLTSELYYPINSQLGKWLADPMASARIYNEGDHLIREALITLHDYLHIWSYNAIDEIMPELGFGHGPLNRGNLEDHAYLHLLTEVMAVVGFDYWFLCERDFNERVDIGTAHKTGIALPYSRRFLKEAQRLNPAFDPQDKAFFEIYFHFFMEGHSFGFQQSDCARSPLLADWIRSEFDYVHNQRMYTRKWLISLADEPITVPGERLRAPFVMDKPWKTELARVMCDLIWDKIKNNSGQTFFRRRARDDHWQRVAPQMPDFSLNNLNRWEAFEFELPPEFFTNEEQFTYYFSQTLATYDFTAFDKRLTKLFPALLTQRDSKLLASVLAGQTRLPQQDGEPYNLFLIN